MIVSVMIPDSYKSKVKNNLVTYVVFVSVSYCDPFLKMNQNYKSKFNFDDIHFTYDALFVKGLLYTSKFVLILFLL